MTFETLVSPDHSAAVETFFERGWTDGLPIIPPVRASVEATLAVADLDGAEILGTVSQRQRSLRAWQAATCSVMAGCRPEYFPVVVATWEAMFDPRFNLHSVLSSTGGAAIAGVVSGPYADTIGMNARSNVFGQGNRANATIGRAVRLAAMTALEATPGALDASSFGHAGKYTMHFAEDTPSPPWRPIREQLGFPSSATTVTVFPAEAPRQINQLLNADPEGIARTVAACMRNPSQAGTGVGTRYLIALGPEHAGVLVEAGWSQRDVRAFLSSASRVTRDELVDAGVIVQETGVRAMRPDPDGMFVTAAPADILVFTAGGPGAGWSAAIPSWTIVGNAQPITRPIRLPGEGDPPTSRGTTEDLHFL